MSTSVEYSGVISSVAPGGRSGLVRLDHEIDGRRFAVISANTTGRITAMNGVGELLTHTRVRGHGDLGSEAVLALSVEVVSSELVD